MKVVITFFVVLGALYLTVRCANDTARYRSAFRYIEADSSFRAFWTNISGQNEPPAIAVADSIYPLSMSFFLDEIAAFRNPGNTGKSSLAASKDSARAREYRRSFPAYPARFAERLSTHKKEQLIVVFSEMTGDQMTAMVFPARSFNRRSPLRKVARSNHCLQYLFYFDEWNALRKVYVKRLAS